MLKTYMYLDDNADKEIVALLSHTKSSKAQLYREAIGEGIKVLKNKYASGAEALLRLAELGKKYKLKGPKNSSQKIDELLWAKNWNE